MIFIIKIKSPILEFSHKSIILNATLMGETVKVVLAYLVID